MNLFILDRDPVVAARMHCDGHLHKMCVEACQMMSAAHIVRKSSLWRQQNPWLDELSHEKHPICKWVRASYQNYEWTLTLANELFSEFIRRFGKSVMGVMDFKLKTLEFIPPLSKKKGLTDFAVSVADYAREWLVLGDPVEIYREYYIVKQYHMRMEWNRGRTEPEWFERD